MKDLKDSKVAVVMGSQSDWDVMSSAVQMLDLFKIPYTARIVSAHRTPDLLYQFAEAATQSELSSIIAGAGGAAHLPGMIASKTPVPIIGVPIPSKHLNGLDSLLSIVQMPAGIPVATVAIGEAGAKNAALLSIAMLARTDKSLHRVLQEYRQAQTEKVLAQSLYSEAVLPCE